ncbi:MAG: TonB-dependent receptor [Spongiibacteraceae bacterium]|jgi:iron complex outermembrane receptor protein|nr:TonB-dependent receptor [Spongiibacteraceae bacterium]
MMTSVAALSQEQTTRRYDIAPQGLDEALTQYGLQSGRNIYFRGEQIGERQSEGLQGDYSAEEALIRLLSGTDIRYEVADDGTILITRAQEGADRSPQPARRTLEEVVVTATKKNSAENVQMVPLAVTAYGEEQLERLNFTDLSSLTTLMPNVALDEVGSVGGYANFSIRGLGLNSSIPSVEPTVGVFIDGVYMGVQAGIVIDGFDIESIEVLRGPQGVLFGRNVTGGAVVLNTTSPTDEFSFRAKAAVETGPKYVTTATVSGPLVPGVLSGKLALYYSDDKGYFETIGGRDVGATDMKIIRPALRFSPSGSLDIQLQLEHGEGDGDGTPSQNFALNRRGTLDLTLDEVGFNRIDWNQATLITDWDVGIGTLTNITAWREIENIAAIDLDGTPWLCFHVPRQLVDQDQVSTELRYAFQVGDLALTTGVFYFEQDLLYLERRQLFAGATDITGGGQMESSTFGIFAAADYALTDTLTLNIGARYSRDEKTAQTAVSGPTGCDAYTRQCDFTFKGSDAWEDLSPRIGLQWILGEDTNLYATWSQGFRSGGYNLRQANELVPPGPIEPEEQSSFEVGLKSDFFDKRVRTNIAIFYNKIDKMQRDVTIPVEDVSTAQVITNVGKATVHGVEFEGQWIIDDYFTLSAQVGYMDGKYNSVDYDLNRDGRVDGADKALDLPRQAPWSYGLAVDYQNTVPVLGDVAARLSYSHRDNSYFSDDNTGVLGSFSSLDFNLSSNLGTEHFKVSLYGNNILDKVTYNAVSLAPDLPNWGGDGPAGPLRVPSFSIPNKGRVLGASVQYVY